MLKVRLTVKKFNVRMSRRRKHVKIENETTKKIKKEPDTAAKVRLFY